jgi:hypothetical protein
MRFMGRVLSSEEAYLAIAVEPGLSITAPPGPRCAAPPPLSSLPGLTRQSIPLRWRVGHPHFEMSTRVTVAEWMPWSSHGMTTNESGYRHAFPMANNRAQIDPWKAGPQKCQNRRNDRWAGLKQRPAAQGARLRPYVDGHPHRAASRASPAGKHMTGRTRPRAMTFPGLPVCRMPSRR